jgi:hypothetical protein
MLPRPVVLPKLSYDEALELLYRAIAEKGPDYVYEKTSTGLGSCAYFIDNQPSCIVGHVLAYKGVKPEDLPGRSNTAQIGALAVGEDSRTNYLLDMAQVYQDRGVPWGQAVENALAWVNDTYSNDEDEEEDA